MEAVGSIQPGNAESGPVQDGDDISEESGGPHDPGTHTEPFSAGELVSARYNALRLHHVPAGRIDANPLTVKSLTAGLSVQWETSWLKLHPLVGVMLDSASSSQLSACTSNI
jgi:hypothetical protein